MVDFCIKCCSLCIWILHCVFEHCVIHNCTNSVYWLFNNTSFILSSASATFIIRQWRLQCSTEIKSKGRRNIGFDFLVKSIHIKVQYYVSIEVWVIPAKRQHVQTILLCNVHCPCWGVARPGGFLTSSRYNLCTFSSCNVSTVARRVGWVSCPLCDTVLSSKERPLHNKVQMKFNKINKNEDTFAFTTEPRVHCAW